MQELGYGDEGGTACASTNPERIDLGYGTRNFDIYLRLPVPSGAWRAT